MPKSDYLIQWLEPSLGMTPKGLVFEPSDLKQLEAKFIAAAVREDFIEAATDLLGYCDFISQRAQGQDAALAIVDFLAGVFGKAGRSDVEKKIRAAGETIRGKTSEGPQLGAPTSGGVRLRK